MKPFWFLESMYFIELRIGKCCSVEPQFLTWIDAFNGFRKALHPVDISDKSVFDASAVGGG